MFPDQNPFSGFGKVVFGDRLVGRQSEIALLFASLQNANASAAVIGTPRIGKTSLVHEVFQRLSRESNLSVARAEIDVSTIPDSVELFREIAAVAALDAPERGATDFHRSEDKGESSYEAYRSARRLLLAARSAGRFTQVAFDEFDAVRRFTDAQATIQRLRDLIYRTHETGFSAVFVARRSLRALEQSIADVSTLDGVCEQCYVRPLAHDGLEEMVARARANGWPEAAEQIQTLNFYTGGHPFLAEMIMAKGWPSQSVSAGAELALGSVYDFYEQLRKLLEEDGTFGQLLEITVGPRSFDKPGSVERAVRYGLIIAASNEQSTYRGWSEHFQLYLDRCARLAPWNEIWRETEGQLRDFISGVFSHALGPSWWTEIVRRHPGLAPVFAGCEDRMAKERRNFGLHAESRILEFCYPMDLWRLISAEWSMFEGVLKQTRSYWNDRFAHLAKIRTPTAHNRDATLPLHEVRLAEAYCQEFLALLGAQHRVGM